VAHSFALCTGTGSRGLDRAQRCQSILIGADDHRDGRRSFEAGREKKRQRADELGELVAAILAEFRDRVLPVDIDTARHIARLAEKTYCQPIPLADLIVTAVRHGLTLLTHNMDEIARLGIGARDPFAKLPPDA